MSDRRTRNRRRCHLNVTSECGSLEGRATNISESGLYLQSRCDGVLKIGDRYDLRIALGGSHIEVQAEIVESRSELFYEAGAAQFTGMSFSALQRLRQFTDSLDSREADSTLGRVKLIQRPAS
jgi:hypothetical protein